MVYIGETGWSLKKRLQICSEDQQHGERDCSLCLELTTPCRLNQLTESEEEEGIGRHPHYIREQPNNTNLAPLEPDLASPSTLYFTFYYFFSFPPPPLFPYLLLFLPFLLHHFNVSTKSIFYYTYGYLWSCVQRECSFCLGCTSNS